MSHRSPDRKKREVSPRTRVRTGVAVAVLGLGLIVVGVLLASGWWFIPGAILVILGLLSQRAR